jgi:hypothetical protein
MEVGVLNQTLGQAPRGLLRNLNFPNGQYFIANIFNIFIANILLPVWEV